MRNLLKTTLPTLLSFFPTAYVSIASLFKRKLYYLDFKLIFLNLLWFKHITPELTSVFCKRHITTIISCCFEKLLLSAKKRKSNNNKLLTPI